MKLNSFKFEYGEEVWAVVIEYKSFTSSAMAFHGRVCGGGISARRGDAAELDRRYHLNPYGAEERFDETGRALMGHGHYVPECLIFKTKEEAESKVEAVVAKLATLADKRRERHL